MGAMPCRGNSLDPCLREGLACSMKGTLLILRVIHVSLLLGPASFLAIGLLEVRGSSPRGGQPELFYLGIALGVVLGLASFIAPRLLVGRTPDANRPLAEGFGVYHTAKIIQWGLVEGGAIFNSVVVFLSGNQISAACAVGLIGLLAFHRPSRAEFCRWLSVPEHRMHELDS